MCPLSLHESISGSVMTKRSGGRVQLNRNLSQPQLKAQRSVPLSNRLSRSSAVKNALPLLTPVPILAEKSSAYPGRSACPYWRSHSTHWLHVLTQVGKLRVRCLLVLFLVLSLQSQPVMCKVWLTEQPGQITFKSRLCRPVSQEDLKSRLGKSFDARKMAADGTSAKPKFGDTAGYLGDDPYAGYDLDDLDVLEDPIHSSDDMWLREEEIYTDESMYNGVSHKKDGFDSDPSVHDEEGIEKGKNSHGEDEDESGGMHAVRRSWVPRRSIIGSHRRDEGRRNDFPEEGLADGKSRSNANKSDLNNKYMRRRRRRRSLLLNADPRAPKPGPRDSNEKDSIKRNKEKSRSDRISAKSLKKSSDANLTLQLILSGRKRNKRKLRKQLKKEFRQRARKQNKSPPWQCKFKQWTKFLDFGVFPRTIQDGRCMSDKCFYRLYNCEPIKYTIKLLQRDPYQCNPLPLEGNGTVYEERWNLISRYITVGCNCASLADSSRSKNRRKN